MPRSTNGVVTREPDEDWDALIGEIDLSPVVVKLAGRVYSVRRDLTQEEVPQYWKKAAERDDVGCLQMLVGDDDGATLNGVLDKLPQLQSQAILKRIMIRAGLIQDTGERAGEAQAS